jgi:hypothetical protein
VLAPITIVGKIVATVVMIDTVTGLTETETTEVTPGGIVPARLSGTTTMTAEGEGAPPPGETTTIKGAQMFRSKVYDPMTEGLIEMITTGAVAGTTEGEMTIATRKGLRRLPGPTVNLDGLVELQAISAKKPSGTNGEKIMLNDFRFCALVLLCLVFESRAHRSYKLPVYKPVLKSFLLLVIGISQLHATENEQNRH